MSQRVPWLVIRCMFKDEVGLPEPHPLDYYAALVTAPDIENVRTFWQDMSYGELDFSGSEVTPWLKLEKNRGEYTGSGANPQGRQDLVNWAKQAAQAFGAELSRFRGFFVATYRQTDTFGSGGQAVCGPNDSLSTILQEVGHGLGLMNHSRSVAKPGDYEHPFCIMSAETFGDNNPTFFGRFGKAGPGLCAPYVFKTGWLAEARIAKIPTNGRSPRPTVLTLSPIRERQLGHKQVAMIQLNTPQEVTYFVEYRSGGWDRGLGGPTVVIDQLRPDGFAYYAGSITASTPGSSYVDAQYNLSVRCISNVFGNTVTIQAAPAAAVQTLSLRQTARATLGLTNGFSVKRQVLSGVSSLRERLIY